jgi:hypothetical protein
MAMDSVGASAATGFDILSDIYLECFCITNSDCPLFTGRFA